MSASMEEDRQYLERINIESVFKELLSRLIEDRQYSTEEIQQFLIKNIKMISYSNRCEFYEDSDFEVMFSSFDTLKKEEISVENLFIIFKIFRISFDKETILNKHKITGNMVTKKQYMKIIKREYSRMVSLDTNNL